MSKSHLNKYLLLLFLLLLGSCASGGKKERDALREYVSTGRYNEAIHYLEKNKFYNDKDTQLLKYMELGLVAHMDEDYYQSIQYLEKAKEIHQKLFTVSISKKASTLVLNDTYDKYYGFTYERSLIHFYLSFNHFMLFQNGEYFKKVMKEGKEQKEKVALNAGQKRQELYSSRAELVAWDSYLDSIKHKKLGKSVFKIDLLGKTFGAFVHETIGTVNDQRIALQLYKDAKKFLFRNYNTYQTFNKSFVKFKSDFDKLPSLNPEDVKKNYVQKTYFQNSLKDYLDYKILSLTKRLSPRDFKVEISRQNPNKEVLKRVEKNGGKESNLAIIFQRGFIPKKVGAKQYYGLRAVLNDPNASQAAKAAAAIGHIALTVFAADKLGLMPPPKNWSPVGARVGIHVASAAVEHAAIAFELPEMENAPIGEKLFVEFYDTNNNLVYKQEAPVVNPMGDIAAEAIAEDSAARYTRIGVRLATKHILAIVAAHQLYKSQEKQLGKAFARALAVGSYIAASKGIEASEKADIRYWSTLPADFRFTDVFLPAGKYKVKASLISLKKQGNEEEAKKVYNLGEVVVNNKEKTLVNFRSI